MKRVLITTSSFGKEDTSVINMLYDRGYEVTFNPYGRKLTEAEVSHLIKEVKPIGIIAGTETLTGRVLSDIPSLKVISRCGIGLDNVDLDAAGKKGITVTNTPDGPSRAVAELTVGLILAALRNIPRSDASIRAGGWKRPMGKLLGEQTVGIVGCGRIGTAVGHLISSFGARVYGYDPYITEHLTLRLVSLSKLLKSADIISLHLPYDSSVYHMVDIHFMQNMKKGSLLVNTSRGGIVDEQALYAAIKAEQLAGACIDTFENEPYDGPLAKLPQVVLTPHFGSYAREARIKMEEEAVANLLSILKE